jgi:hypothetical protein
MAVAPGDVNGDGHPDLVITGGFSTLMDTVMLNDGAGGFTASSGIAPGLTAGERYKRSVCGARCFGGGGGSERRRQARPGDDERGDAPRPVQQRLSLARERRRRVRRPASRLLAYDLGPGRRPNSRSRLARSTWHPMQLTTRPALVTVPSTVTVP